MWADTAYRSWKNAALLVRNGFTSQVHRKKPVGRPMPTPIRRANGRKSAVRARIEHVFAVQKDRMGLLVRTIELARETQDRARRSRLQHEALHVENCGGDIARTAGPSLPVPSNGAAQRLATPAPTNNRPRQRIFFGLQLMK